MMREVVALILVGLVVLSNAVRIAVIGKPRPAITASVAVYAFIGDLFAIVALLYLGGLLG
jgi:hypothetical protein